MLAAQKNANLTALVSDGAEPRVTGAKGYSTLSGLLDRIEVDWSESLVGSNQADWSVSGIPNGSTLQSATASGAKTILGFGGQTEADTDLSLSTISFTNGGTHKDSANNTAVSSPINGLSFPLYVQDLAQPIVMHGQTEAAANGMVGSIRLNLSESVSGAAPTVTLSGVIQSGSISVSGSAIVIGTQYLSDTGVLPKVTLSGGSVIDSMGNPLALVTNLAVSDGVAPYVLSRITKDLNGNGRTDAISVLFSEATTLNAPLMHATVAGKSVSGYSASCSGNGSAVCINVTESAVTETSLVPTVQLDHTPGALTDAAGNAVTSEIASNPTTDGIGPVVASASYDAATHSFAVSYSESIS